ncbi:hypothetical protein BpHYR1_010467 [Brachionus plicatilis]|uniref:Uncharacterized protein n=1 Tax=Brachionus plicatilis TaxID=10195 RepID=A0A3M7T0N8_BRAPC|nr:hypothetical protein BpHYR1_010467 [Brachionus plicatilis]
MMHENTKNRHRRLYDKKKHTERIVKIVYGLKENEIEKKCGSNRVIDTGLMALIHHSPGVICKDLRNGFSKAQKSKTKKQKAALFYQNDCNLDSSDNNSDLEQAAVEQEPPNESIVVEKAYVAEATVFYVDLPRKRGRPKKSTTQSPPKNLRLVKIQLICALTKYKFLNVDHCTKLIFLEYQAKYEINI